MASSQTVAVLWCFKEQLAPHDIQTNVFLAAFTTCYARLKLYEVLEQLQERVLYFDTDSIIFKTENGSNPAQLDGETIIVFVSGNTLT